MFQRFVFYLVEVRLLNNVWHAAQLCDPRALLGCMLIHAMFLKNRDRFSP